MAKLRSCLLLALAVNSARGHVAYMGLPNRLHQVTHGVYVNPSIDGASADLYVAATEDQGLKTQWLTDHTVNYLHPAHQGLPVTYTSTYTTSSLPHEETVTNQKRAVVSGPPIKYAYAFPVSSDGTQSLPYPYAMPTAPTTQTEGTECSETPASSAYSYPLHLYYSQMMAAFANALNSVKESNGSEEATSSTPAAPVWPSYGYPVQYVMVDPSAWAKTQTASSAAATTTPAPNAGNAASSNESV